MALQAFTSTAEQGAARSAGMGTPGRCPWEGMGVWGAGLNYLPLISTVSSGLTPPVPPRKVRNISQSTGSNRRPRWGADAYLPRRSRLPAAHPSCCGRSSSRGACTAACAWSCRPTAAPRCWAGRASRSRGPGGCVSSAPRPRRSCPANAKPAVTSHHRRAPQRSVAGQGTQGDTGQPGTRIVAPLLSLEKAAGEGEIPAAPPASFSSQIAKFGDKHT